MQKEDIVTAVMYSSKALLWNKYRSKMQSVKRDNLRGVLSV